jgi:outer membrane lipoprotein SlyB
MKIIQRIQRLSAAAAIVAFAGACAGNSLGNVLGSVLGGGSQNAQSGQLSGTIRSVDTRSQQIAIQQSNGQTVPVYYDNQTQVVFQNQNYSPTSLENGDRVTARIQANGNNYYTDYVQVDQSVSGSSAGTSGLQMIQGTVRQVDLRNGWFVIADANSNNTLTVTVPYNLNSNDINRFRSLRNGDFVRFYGQYLNNSQIQLRQFN